ncbi:Hypothetical protein I5071_52780 [Sandaracinus amylolyticus]|nr:Hypothetical protein I5071_52780 [Sandaracinus amylolyticus]
MDPGAYGKHVGTDERLRDGHHEVRCRFCHTYVDARAIGAHEAVHMRRRPDGQQQEHITLPPDRRYAGPLDDVPQVYVHEACGGATGMPEEIIRSYLGQPFLYNGNTFCTGCGTYVPFTDLVWEETGETLDAYTRALQAEYIRKHGGRPCG